jgi:hypothetical protein
MPKNVVDLDWLKTGEILACCGRAKAARHKNKRLVKKKVKM